MTYRIQLIKKDEDLLHSKDEPSLNNSIKLTSNSCSINNCTKTVNYESTSVSYNDTKASNCKYEYPILDQLGFDFFSLQDNWIDTIRLKNLIKEMVCVFKDNNTQMNVESWNGRGNKVLVTIPFVGYLSYDTFKENCKNSNFMNQNLDTLSNNAGFF